jgi:alpha-N-arabinofuranosidase
MTNRLPAVLPAGSPGRRGAWLPCERREHTMVRYLKIVILSTVVAAVFAPFAGAQNPTLTLNFGQATTKIERALYGHLWENLGRDIYNGVYVGTKSTIPHTNGFRNDVIQAFIEEGMPCLEWPGGCAVWSYHWQDGIGPKASRPGGDMVNGVGTAEYFEICKMINAEPYITANIRSASTAENTAWLKYIDSVPEWKNSLKYWKIGNEEFGGCGGRMEPADYAKKYLENINAIPASYAGKLIRIGEAGTEPAYASVVIDACKGKLDAISYHYYAVDWGNKGSSTDVTEALYYKQLQSAWGLEAKLKGFETLLNQKDPDNTIGIMVDEWGAWLEEIKGMGALYQQSSVRDAVLAMMSLNIVNNHCKRVKMALAAQACNVIFASILTQPSPGTAMVKTPTYYVLKMLRPHQNATMIPVSLVCGNVNNIPIISASASIDSTGSVHISLGNNHATTAQTLSITLNGAKESFAKITGQIVNGPSYSSYNDFNKAETATLQDFPATNYSLSGSKITVTLPAHSAVMLKLPATVSVASAMSGGHPGKVFIRPEIGGKIVITAPSLQSAPAAPVVLSLYAANGRLAASTTISGGSMDVNNQSVWQPSCRTGVYIVKLQAGQFSEIRHITLLQ